MKASPQTIAVLAILHVRHGRARATRDQIDEAVDSLPNASHASAAQRQAIAGEVERWLAADFASLIGFPAADDALSLTPEEDAQLVELLRSRGAARGGTLESHDLSAVTRRFLEDVLAEATIPDELLEAIVEAYVRRGTLRMNEDGTRYRITL